VDFKNVTTSAARYQNLSLNPGKLSGQCGRLKCCLNYELDTYMEAIKDIPQVDKPLLTEQGPAKLQKTDIFRKLMWFNYNHDNDWISITCDRVREIQALNEQGVKVFNLQVDDSNEVEDLAAQSTRELELLDRKFSKKKKKKKRPTDGNAPRVNQGQGPRPEASTPKPADQSTAMATPAQVRPAEGNQSPRQGDKRRKNKNRPRPNSNQGPAASPATGMPKADSPAPKPVEKPQEGPRKFPPRINQGPSGNPGND
jgi:hypothetical protein